MEVGGAMFFTNYAMDAGAFAQALEDRGFDSVWAPEHSHIPASRQTPFPQGGELPRKYAECMDPFVSLTLAAAMTKTIKLGTGVCLVVQRDPIQTAKLVASLDQVSRGRFLFGIGGGWNAEEMADHGTTDFKGRWKLVRERVEAMKAIWTQENPGVSWLAGRVRTDARLAETGPNTASTGHRRWCVSVRRAAGDRVRRRLGAAWLSPALRRRRPVPAGVLQNGEGSRPRSGLAAGDAVRHPRRHRSIALLPRCRRRACGGQPRLRRTRRRCCRAWTNGPA